MELCHVGVSRSLFSVDRIVALLCFNCLVLCIVEDKGACKLFGRGCKDLIWICVVREIADF